MLTISQAEMRRALIARADNMIPDCLEWTVDDVAHWIKVIGLPQYKVDSNFANHISLKPNFAII